MSDKTTDCILKACAITAGTVLLLVCICLYLGDNSMKYDIENCCLIKIILTAVTLLVLGGIIVGIWYCKPHCYFSDYKNFLPVYDSGVVVVRENKTEAIKSYTITHYDTIEEYAGNASSSDIAYVYNSKNIINAGMLAKLCENKDIELRFMNTKAKLIIGTRQKAKTNGNKQ